MFVQWGSSVTPELETGHTGSEWPGVVRSKGFFWLASRPAHARSQSQTGAVYPHGTAGPRWAAVPKSRWPTDAKSLEMIERSWDPNVDDARQELC
jgi:G3E family GTPase